MWPQTIQIKPIGRQGVPHKVQIGLVAGKVEVLVYSTVKARALPMTTMVRSSLVDSTGKEVQVNLVHLGFHNGALQGVHVRPTTWKPRGLTVDDNQLPQSWEVVGDKLQAVWQVVEWSGYANPCAFLQPGCSQVVQIELSIKSLYNLLMSLKVISL